MKRVIAGVTCGGQCTMPIWATARGRASGRRLTPGRWNLAAYEGTSEMPRPAPTMRSLASSESVSWTTVGSRPASRSRPMRTVIGRGGRGSREADERLPLERAPLDGAMGGQPVPRRHCHHEGVRLHRLARKAGRGDRAVHEAQVQPSVQHRVQLLAGRHAPQRHPDLREPAHEPADGHRDHTADRHESDLEPADLAFRRAARQRHRVVRLGQRLAGLLEETLPRLGQLDDPGSPAQQRNADLLLERGDLLAQGRLADVEALRGAPEVQLLGERDEVAEMPELHARIALPLSAHFARS